MGISNIKSQIHYNTQSYFLRPISSGYFSYTIEQVKEDFSFYDALLQSRLITQKLMMASDPDAILTSLKLLIIGESGVGKSSLLLRFTDDAFDPEQAATIGVDFKVKTITINQDKVRLKCYLEALLVLTKRRSVVLLSPKMYVVGQPYPFNYL